MRKETIVENEFFSLWYYPDQKIVHHKFHKFIFGEAFKACLNRGTEVLKENGAEKWLSDDRNNSALPKEDSRWGVEEWLPRTMAVGWRFWAVVMPDKATGRMNMRSLIEKTAAEGITVEVFDDVDEAQQWLVEQ